jgi:hypothetical protein
MTLLSDADAKWRLSGKAGTAKQSHSGNRDALNRIKGGATASPAPHSPRQTPQPPKSRSQNQQVLNKIRSTQPAPAKTTTPQQRASRHSRQQKPPDKGLIGKFFDWLFS